MSLVSARNLIRGLCLENHNKEFQYNFSVVGFSTFQSLSCTTDLDFIALSNSKLEHHPRSIVARAVKAGVKVGNHSRNIIFLSNKVYV